MFSCTLSFLILCFGPNTLPAVPDYQIFQPDSAFEITDTIHKPYKYIVNKIILSGNKITKPQIIYRELLFHENDTITSDKFQEIIEQSRKNLLNASLFNFVTIDTSSFSPGKINISIDVIERWYLWPMPFFQLSDRNFNVWWETKDFSKADYGLYLIWDNFRGRKESLKLIICLGFDETYGLSYNIPYINKKRTIGFGITGGFSGNHEVPYITVENEQKPLKDKEKYLQQNIFGNFGITYRKNIFSMHTFQLNYNNYLFADTLLKLNSGFAAKKNLQFFSFYYQFKCDHRDIKAYPLNGYYYDLQFEKHGFGLLKRENVDVLFIHASVRKYWNLSKRLYFAGGINAKVSTPAYQHYFIERGLGFGNDFARSYEYYVIDGQNFVLFKSNIKFEVIPTRIKKINFISTKKFNTLFYALYLNIFADAAYVSNRQKAGNNNLQNSALFGTGIGLDFVTYYDKVIRVEYSINKMGENGFFFHFVAPI